MTRSVHGKTKTPTWYSWVDMRKRCSNPKCKSYKDYGGRGIKVCDRWLSFNNFYADMGERPENTTLDRIDVNGDYCPENCKWSDPKTQRRNMRTNITACIQGRTQCVSAWCEELEIVGAATALSRIQLGWSPEDAVLTPRLRRSYVRNQS